MSVFVHDHGICETPSVGDGTRVWGFAHVLAGATLGADCNICAHVFIENDVVVGSRVTVKSGVQLYDGVTIEDDVFIGPNATFTNDRFPRSRQRPAEFLRTIVRSGASIGANATILPGLEIGSRAMIGAGAVVTRSVPPNAIVVGNPARIVGYVDAEVSGSLDRQSGEPEPSVAILDEGGAALHRLPVHRDIRGSLAVGEFPEQMPFVPKRFFVVFGVPGERVRGEHAHRVCEQFLVCVSGSVSVLVDNGATRAAVTLAGPEQGLYIPPMTWATQYKYSETAVLLVFASHSYETEDYIRDYGTFLQLRHADGLAEQE